MKHYLITLLAATLVACSGPQVAERPIDEPVEMSPEYREACFPPNIAAPAFQLSAQGADAYQVQVGLEGQEPAFYVDADEDGDICLPLKPWRKLLEQAKGHNIYLRVLARVAGQWCAAPDALSPISETPINDYLVYRLLYPGYELWSNIGIYQRNLTNYEQTPILENKDFDQQCINCHNFSANNPQQGMMIHVRGAQGGTLISVNGKVEKINSRFAGANHGATYPGFSPNGKYIAFSANDVGQVFHSAGTKPIEVIDKAADLIVYNVETRQAFSDSSIMGADYIETFPNWSPDCRTIFFCRAKGIDPTFPLDSVHYDLMAIDFDGARFSNLRTLYAASADSASVSFPRCSPDGRWLMFTRSAYGNFSIWHPEAQLCIMDLRNGTWREMNEVNSNSIESYHSWDSSGRWFVFSSKRLDGLWARPHFAAFDPATGHAQTPFCLPQNKADFYLQFTRTFNIPELIQKPVDNVDALLHGITSQQPISITLTTPQSGK